MHIFFDDEVFHAERHGGVSRYVCELAAALGARNAQVTVFGGWSASVALAGMRPAAGVRVVSLCRPAGWRINKLARRVSRLWGRIEFQAAAARGGPIVYHPSFFDYDQSLARRATAMVVTVHDMSPEILFPDVPREAAARAVKREAIERADKVVCVSRNSESDLLRLMPGVAGRTVVVPNASWMMPEPDRSEWPWGARPFVLLVGRRHGYKNGRQAMEAIARVVEHSPELQIVVCGGRTPGSDGELDFAGGGALRRRMHALVPDDKCLAALYQKAIALLYPSDYEGFGLPVLEAMRCGCPVIAREVSSIPEVGGGAILYADGVHGFARALTELLSDAAVRAHYVALGQQQARQFCWLKAADATLAVYGEAVASRGSSKRREVSS